MYSRGQQTRGKTARKRDPVRHVHVAVPYIVSGPENQWEYLLIILARHDMHGEAVTFVYTLGIEERSADKPNSSSIHHEPFTTVHIAFARLGAHREDYRLSAG